MASLNYKKYLPKQVGQTKAAIIVHIALMFNHYLDVAIALQQMVLDAGYEYDEISRDDDLTYKQARFFSVDTYRELVKPVHKRAIEWAHQTKIQFRYHKLHVLIQHRSIL